MKGHDGWFSPIRLLAIVDPLLSSIIGKKNPFEGIHQITEFWVVQRKETERRKETTLGFARRKERD